MISNRKKGQSVIEIIVAVAIFVVIAGSSVVTILGSFLTSRLAEDETRATGMAKQGLEAIASIRNRDWENLVDGTYGLSSSGSEWNLIEGSDTLGKLTRTVTIASVQRDVNGDIVESGGEIDYDSKKITVNVSWNFTPSKLSAVELSQYLTNWQLAKACIELPSPTPTPTPSASPSPTNTPTPTATYTPTPTFTPTPTPTFTPTPTPSPTPVITTCAQYCSIVLTYSTGTCRRSATTCTSNSEIYQSGGDIYCTGGPNADTCCCRP